MGTARVVVMMVHAEDRYEFGELIGAGAMGEVFAAFDRELGIDVAIKRMLPDLAKSAWALKRFEDEAAVCERMMTPYVVRVLGKTVTRDGLPCIVYERLHGETLAERLERETILSVEETATIITQTARALTRAHQLGIVHRDVKPANIFLTYSRTSRVHVKVIDFGISETANDDGELESCDLSGTPDYLSPEQMLGERRPDPRDDVYALAVVAFECIAGCVPFSGDLDDLVEYATNGEVPSVRSVRPELRSAVDAWFYRALDRQRERRFPTAKELARSLELVLCDLTRPSIATAA